MGEERERGGRWEKENILPMPADRCLLCGLTTSSLACSLASPPTLLPLLHLLACCVPARAALPHRNVNHCLVIFGSLSFLLPSEFRPTLMHEVKAAKAAEQKMLLNYLRSRKGEEGRTTGGGEREGCFVSGEQCPHEENEPCRETAAKTVHSQSAQVS